MAGGIGRFSKRSTQPPQQDNAANHGGQPPAPTAASSTTAGSSAITAVADNNTITAETERPATAFNSFNDGRPSTAGSHGFSAIDGMYDAMGGDDDDGAADNSDMFLSSTPMDDMDNGGAFNGFGVGGGFDGGFGGFDHGGGEEQEQQSGVENNNGECGRSCLALK